MRSLSLLIFFTTVSYNLFSQYTIRESDIHFKKTIVRTIPLNYESNQKLFGNTTLVKILLEAYNCNRITGYKNASCTDTLALETVINNLYSSGDSSLMNYVYHCSSIEFAEEIIVDKHKSEIVFRPVSISLMVPPRYSTKGLLESLITFKYDDCVSLFKKDKRAVAVNPLLNGRNMNYADVFLLKLYSSYIVKIGNEEDLYFDQMAKDPQSTFLLCKQEENELTEYLYKLFNPK